MNAKQCLPHLVFLAVSLLAFWLSSLSSCLLCISDYQVRNTGSYCTLVLIFFSRGSALSSDELQNSVIALKC